jgi:hypothetical protein
MFTKIRERFARRISLTSGVLPALNVTLQSAEIWREPAMSHAYFLKRWLAGVIASALLLSLAPKRCAAAPPDAQQQTRDDFIGAFHFPAPADWKRVEQKEGAATTLTYVAPGSKADQQASLMVTAQPLTDADFKKSFDKIVDQWIAGRRVFVINHNALDGQGYDALARSVMVQDPVKLSTPSADFFALHVGDQIIAVRFSNSIEPTQENNFNVAGYRVPYEKVLAGYKIGDGRPRPGAPLAGGTPPLTQDIANQWIDRYEWAMELKLDDKQKQQCQQAMIARWKENNLDLGAANEVYLAELKAWQTDAKAPGPQAVLNRVRWRARLWLSLCQREGESEMDALLAADKAAHPDLYAKGMLQPAPFAPPLDKPLPQATAQAYGDYIEWGFALKVSSQQRGELARYMEEDRHGIAPTPLQLQRAINFWARLTRLSPSDRDLIVAENRPLWLRLIFGSSNVSDKYIAQLIMQQRPPLAKGGPLEPSLWGESVEAYMRLVCMQANVVSGKQQFQPTPQVIADVSRQLAAAYSQFSGKHKFELSQMITNLAEVRAAWPRFSADDRKAVTASWAQWYAPVQLASVAPSDCDALMHRVLDKEQKEDDAWKKTPEAAQWEKNRYAILSRMEANRHATMIYMTDPDHYELRRVTGK